MPFSLVKWHTELAGAAALSSKLVKALLRLRLSSIRQRPSATGSTATVRRAAHEAGQLDMSPYRFRTSGMHGRRRTSRISMSSSRGNTPGSSATASCLAQAFAHMTRVSATNRNGCRCHFARTSLHVQELCRLQCGWLSCMMVSIELAMCSGGSTAPPSRVTRMKKRIQSGSWNRNRPVTSSYSRHPRLQMSLAAPARAKGHAGEA